MATSTMSGIRIAGMSAAVPKQTRTVADEARIFGAEQAKKIAANVGINIRHVVTSGVCTSDLCCAAAEGLIAQLGWDRAEITGLIFITQTPDYVLPATSYSLHRRLGLSPGCFAFDVNLGCSGYVYGLWMAASLMQTTSGKVLLLVGDTISRITSPQDQSVAFLFGDAGTATALEPHGEAAAMCFEMGADGSGEQKLIVPAGGFRQPRTDGSCTRTLREAGNSRSDEDLFMDGPEVFTFTLTRVPRLIKSILAAAGKDLTGIDHVIFHQANRFMLEHLGKKLQVPREKFVLALEEYGNTSSASIPMAIITSPVRERVETMSQRLLVAGFGVGFSWAAAVIECGPGVFPSVYEYEPRDNPI